MRKYEESIEKAGLFKWYASELRTAPRDGWEQVYHHHTTWGLTRDHASARLRRKLYRSAQREQKSREKSERLSEHYVRRERVL